MHDAAAGGHPLHVAGRERSAVSEAVAVFDRTGQNVSDGFDSTVRMPREPGKIIGRAVVAEIVEQQKRIRLCGVAETECTPQSDARTFDGGLRLHDAFDGTDGHRFNCLSLSPMRRQAGR